MTEPAFRWLARGFRLLIVVLAVHLLGTAGAAAHAVTEATEPADGAVLQASPAVIALVFDDPVRVTAIALEDAGGTAHALERSSGPAPVTRFEAIPADLPPGDYTVEWRGLAADGHPMQGRFSFTVD
jgi:methionine-rich copper-binding protein CopC